jgi:4'-phosphopantetheinyl transferase
LLVHWLAGGEAQVPTSQAWLSRREAERLALMRYTKRRNDFLLGRWTAKQALARRLGIAADDLSTLATIEVRNAPDGAPEAFVGGAPADHVVAMTDRAGWAVCALIDGDRRVGCDLELVEPRSDAFVATYLTPTEQALVAADDDDRHRTANLVWSAKESALKVLRTGLRRDTRSVEVTLVGDDAADGWRQLRVRAEEGVVFPGWWRQYGEFLLTIAAESDFPPPCPIVEPTGLESATPSHSWMAAPRTGRRAGS